ncbi:MAG: hypothetical protein V4693_12015 [Pseudomonadota bacterium]
MTEIKSIREAMLRLSCIGHAQFNYDPSGRVFGDGPIHYLVEVGDLCLIAWEDNHTRTMVVNPITRFDLVELGELGAGDPWTVLRVPAESAQSIQFREIEEAELIEAYRKMRDAPENRTTYERSPKGKRLAGRNR